MSGANFIAAIDSDLLPAVSLEIEFTYALYEAMHEVVDVLANCQANTTASGLPAEQIDLLNNTIYPELEVFDLREAENYLLAYYGNTELLIGYLANIFAILNDLNPTAPLQALVDQYNPDGEFNMSDEDFYKIPAYLLDKMIDAKADLEIAIDLLNAP